MESQALNVAIVGGGPGCKAIMDIMFAEKLSQLRMKLIGVACTNPKAVGYRYAQEKGIYTTKRYHDLYKLKGLDMIIELTGRDEVAEEIARTRPGHVRLMDHVGARLFWDIFQVEEKRLEERKRAEEAVRESGEKYRTQFEEALDPIFIADAETGILVDCNRAALELVGRARSELLGKHQRILHPPEEVEGEFSRTFKQHLEEKEGQALEARVITKNGEIRDVSVKANIFELKGKKLLQGIFRDITYRKRADEALIRAKEDWENTFDAITDMVMLLDSEHQIIRVNRAAAEALNTTKDALVGKKCYEAVHRQGHPIRQCPLVDTMKTLEPYTVEIENTDLGGTFICTTSPMVDRDGKLVGYTHCLKEITESKRLEAQFQQAQKMEAIGTLAGGIAHDFNNLLMGIQGRTSLMLMDVGFDHPHFEHLKGIEDAIQRGTDLSKQLLGFARRGKYEVQVTDLNLLIEKSAEMFGRTRKEISIHRKYEKNLRAVEVDQGQMDQVLLNLYVNAWQAMPGGGELYLETENVTLDRQYTEPFNVEPGNYVKITVTDTGVGMDEVTRQRAFEPFFTTKETGGGTGLGLASAYGIISNHGGMINVYSEPGHGTSVEIYLPTSEKELIREREPSIEVLEGTEKVLLVDDEDMILNVGKEMLTALGYTVMLARSGQEGIRLYKEKGNKVDMVILDMVMPDMGGGEVYDKLKEINPKIKVLLSSGYSVDGQADQILRRGCNGFIQKPFNVKQLSSKLREILDQ